MLDFWMEHGPGMIGIVLARLAETFATLGLFTLPVSIGALAGRPPLHLDRRQRWLAGALLAALVVGFIVRGEILRLTPLFPFRNDPLSPRGFYVDDKFYGGTLPDSVLIPDGVLAILTLGALLGGGLLAVALVAVLSRETIRGPASMPLLFGLITLGPTVVYYKFWGDYVLAFLPSALLATLLAFGGPRGSAAVDRRRPLTRRAQWSPAPALIGVALLAAWSVWWERDFLARQAALWQAGRALIEQGIPPEEIDGGFEWNGWYRGQAAIAAVVERSKGGRVGREMQGYIIDGLHMKL